MRGIAFSHTRMANGGFCTIVGGLTADGKVIQVRLRSDQNKSLKYSYFNCAEDLVDDLRPGVIVEVTKYGYFPAHLKRITHPEDVYIRRDCFRVENSVPPQLDKLLSLAKTIACESIHQVFPGMFKSNGKLYRPGALPNARSVGYVYAQEVHFYNNGKLRAFVKDAAGNTFDVPVVGVDLLGEEQPENFGNSLVRVSLADSFSIDSWRETEHPSRCYLMLSHVMAM